jgi:hypothetical protein
MEALQRLKGANQAVQVVNIGCGMVSNKSHRPLDPSKLVCGMLFAANTPQGLSNDNNWSTLLWHVQHSCTAWLMCVFCPAGQQAVEDAATPTSHMV